MSTSYQKLFMVECYAWLMAGCVIEEYRGLAWANGFAPTNGMGRRSRALETTPLQGLRDKKRVNVPANTGLGDYNLTIDVLSWQYLDTQAQTWISLQSASLRETLVLTNNPIPSTNPRSNPSSSGQSPSTSTNKTMRSSVSLLGVISSVIIPVVVAGYAALGASSRSIVRQPRQEAID